MFPDRLGQQIKIHRTAFIVDIGPIRRDPDRNDRRTELLQNRRCHLIGGPVGTVQDDPQAVQIEITRERMLEKHNITTTGVVHPIGFADRVGHRP